MRFFKLFLLMIFTLMLNSCFDNDKVLGLNDKAPKLEVLNLDKKEIIYDDFNKKIVMLRFFNENCKSCEKTFPKLNELSQKYEEKLKIIAIRIGQSKKELIQIKESYNIQFELLDDIEGSKTAKKYSVFSSPSSFIIKDGRIVYKQEGLSKKLIKKLLSYL